MRILVLVDRYLPDVSGTAIRTANLLEPVAQLTKHQLHVATINICTFDNQTTQEPSPVEELINGVSVHRSETMHRLVVQLPLLHRRYKFDLVHARGSRFAGYALLALAAYRVPVVLELNYLFPQQSPVRDFLWRQTLHRVRRTIVLSEAARGWLHKQMQVDPASVDVIVNGIDSRRFMPASGQVVRNKLGLPDTSVVVGYLGTFWDWQGVLEVAKSAALVLQDYPHVRYLMVGDGPELAGTKQLVYELGLADAFVFTGSVPQSVVPQYLAAMDMFVLARPRLLLNELAVPLKLLEAMAMELPVIVTDLPALTEVVKDGVNGLVTEPDTASLAGATARLVEDEDLRSNLGKTARRMAIERFSWNLAATQLLRSYELATSTR